MSQVKKIEKRTIDFILWYYQLKNGGKFATNEDLLKIMGVKTVRTITEILAKRQNIQPDQWNNFKTHFKITDNSVPRSTKIEQSQINTDKQSSTDPLTEALAIIKQQNDYLQRLLDISLAELSQDVKNGHSRLGAEIRGYGQYPIMKSVNWDQEAFVKEMAKVGSLVGANLKVDETQGT